MKSRKNSCGFQGVSPLFQDMRNTPDGAVFTTNAKETWP